MTEIVIKAEATFYAELSECPRELLASTLGLRLEKRGSGTFLILNDEILTPGTLFAAYLADASARCVFGAEQPLFKRVAIIYNNEGRPVHVDHFNTRLLLAFVEVQLGLGFHGAALVEHQKALQRLLSGESADLVTNYYDPFAHRDHVGIHYVLGRDQRGSGYSRADWELYISYGHRVMERAFALDPATFGSQESLKRAKAQFPDYVAEMHARDGSLVMVPIRHWSKVVDSIMARQAPEKRALRHPRTGEPMPYVSFLDCLLDMPYKPDALVIFQSICGSR
ncbi:MAG: hypothetical protein H5T69_03165 [Chloroflexi bacterium]|nr:hypothetical protein [Chloroflexota bacterium]